MMRGVDVEFGSYLTGWGVFVFQQDLVCPTVFGLVENGSCMSRVENDIDIAIRRYSVHTVSVIGVCFLGPVLRLSLIHI